jgi:nitrogen fixation NifU-like protein
MDRIRLAIRVENHVIADARFKAQGCPPTLAAASSLTELIIGLSVAAAEQIGRQDIVRSLGRLPAAKSHCAALAVDALRAAIEDFRSRG